MKPDPIVADVRAVRDRLAARFNYDIDAIVRHIQSVEAASGRTYVQPPQSNIAAPALDYITIAGRTDRTSLALRRLHPRAGPAARDRRGARLGVPRRSAGR